MLARRNSKIVLWLGLMISLVCLLDFFVDALRATGQSVEPFNIHSVTTAVSLSALLVGSLFFLLNIPPTIAFVLLELVVQHYLTPRVRIGVVYLGVTTSVLAWWWLLALLTRRKVR